MRAREICHFPQLLMGEPEPLLVVRHDLTRPQNPEQDGREASAGIRRQQVARDPRAQPIPDLSQLPHANGDRGVLLHQWHKLST